MTASAYTLYELNAYTFVKSLVLCFTCPFQIVSNRWVSYNFNIDMSIGPGCVWSIRPALAAAILHKNDKQLACNRHNWKKKKQKQKQKQSKKYSQKTTTNHHSCILHSSWILNDMVKWSKSTLSSKDYSALGCCFLLDLLHKGVLDGINT